MNDYKIKGISQSFNQKGKTHRSKITIISVQNPSLSNYSCFTPNPHDSPTDTTSVNNEVESPVRVYSKTNYSFPPLSFRPGQSDFHFLTEHTATLKYKILLQLCETNPLSHLQK